jgi:hypothetical protein
MHIYKQDIRVCTHLERLEPVSERAHHRNGHAVRARRERRRGPRDVAAADGAREERGTEARHVRREIGARHVKHIEAAGAQREGQRVLRAEREPGDSGAPCRQPAPLAVVGFFFFFF